MAACQTDRTFSVVLFSSASPRHVARLIDRIHLSMRDVRVAAVLYEVRPGKSLRARIRGFVGNLRAPGFPAYVAGRLCQSAGRIAGHVADHALRFAHACPRLPNGPLDYGLDRLRAFCQSRDVAMLVTNDIHSAAALAFVRAQAPDLGVVYGTRILKRSLFEIPTHGSINIHQRKVPEYRGGGPIGLWELLDDQTTLGVTVHQVAEAVDAGHVVAEDTLPIHEFDTLTSLARKAHVLGDDLLLTAIAQFAAGDATPRPQTGAGRTFKTPAPHVLYGYENELRRRRRRQPQSRGRSVPRLMARSILFAPFVVARNWARRVRGRFPVVILYHHIVTDRPNQFGITTDGFARHVEYLRKHYAIVSLAEAIAQLRSGRVNRPTVVLTLDDGYAENFGGLRAIVEDTGVPVTLFVSTDKVARQHEFAHDLAVDQRGFIALSCDQVIALSRGPFEIGSHTRTHFDCGSSDPAALQIELVESRRDLESWLGRQPRFFAFPWGLPANMSAAAVSLARQTYEHVLSAFGGENHPARDGQFWHLRRRPHPNSLWELELQIQSLLEFSSVKVDFDSQDAPVPVGTQVPADGI